MKEKAINSISIAGIVIGILLVLVSFLVSNIAFFIGGVFETLAALYLYIFYNLYLTKKKVTHRKLISVFMGILYVSLIVYVSFQAVTIKNTQQPISEPPIENSIPGGQGIMIPSVG